MTQEVLKLVLEVLEENQHLIEEHERPEYLAQYNRVIGAVAKALAQPDATMQSLKDLKRTVCDEVGKAAFAQPAQPQQEQDGCPVCGSDVHDRDALDKAEREIERLSALVAQPQQEPPFSVQQAYAMALVCLDLHEALGCKWGDNPYLAIAGLREAQPQQEPAYDPWRNVTPPSAGLEVEGRSGDYPIPYRELFPPKSPHPFPQQEAAIKEALAQPQQEPVQRYSPDDDGGMEMDSFGAWVEFTSPPQRTWVGLTHDEDDECACKADAEAERKHTQQWALLYRRAIEAKLKEKNT